MKINEDWLRAKHDNVIMTVISKFMGFQGFTFTQRDMRQNKCGREDKKEIKRRKFFSQKKISWVP